MAEPSPRPSEAAVERIARALCFFQTGTLWSQADENTKETYRIAARRDPDVQSAIAIIEAALRARVLEEVREAHSTLSENAFFYWLDNPSPLTTEGSECLSCGEVNEGEKCPKSQRPCGHHCNHSWTHDECDWCGKKFGDLEKLP